MTIRFVDGSRIACAFLVYMLLPLPRCSVWVSSLSYSPEIGQ